MQHVKLYHLLIFMLAQNCKLNIAIIKTIAKKKKKTIALNMLTKAKNFLIKNIKKT